MNRLKCQIKYGFPWAQFVILMTRIANSAAALGVISNSDILQADAVAMQWKTQTGISTTERDWPWIKNSD